MNDYEQRKQERIERYEALASRHEERSSALCSSARSMASVIPMGQPILIGHHSEGRDRRYRARIENKFRASYEEQKTAEYWARRAEAAANNHAISSDDPEALQKLKKELAGLELLQEKMKEANKAIRKGDDEALRAMGFNDSRIQQLKTPDFCGRIGFPSYAITNNGANMRRIRERIEHLTLHANDQTTVTKIGLVTITDNVEENRLQVEFPGKPSDEIRQRLKSFGFHWSPDNGVWQRMRSNAATYQAKEIATSLLPAEHQEAIAQAQSV